MKRGPFVYTWRGVWLLLAFVAVGLTAWQNLPELRLDNSLRVWFVDDDPALIAYESFIDAFGSDEVVVTVVEAGDDGHATLAHIQRLTDDLKSINGVDRVHSVTSSPPELLNGRAGSRLKGHEENVFVIYSWMQVSPELDEHRAAVIANIRAATNRHFGEQRSRHAGIGVITEALNEAFVEESTLFTPLSYAMVLLLLVYLTRSVRWVLATGVTVVLANLTLFSSVPLLGRELTVISMALPPLILICSVANTLHISKFLAESEAGPDIDDVWTHFKIVLKPCVFNALTTAGGFLSLLAANMAVTRDYGLFAAVAVLSTLLFSILTSMIVLRYSTRRRERASSSISTRAVRWALAHRSAVLAGTVLVAAMLISGLTSMHADTYSIGFLPKEHIVRQDSEAIEGMAGNYLPLNFAIHVNDTAILAAPAFRAALENAEAAILDRTSADRGSLFLEALLDARATLGGMPDEQRDAAAVKAILAMPNGDTVWDAGTQTLKLSFMVPMASARTLGDQGTVIADILQAELATWATVNKTGYLPLYSRLVANLIRDQVTSIALALVCVSLLMAVFLRSWRLLFIALTVNSLPILCVLGVMGHTGVALDVATITVAPAMLGIIVDDTLHLLYHLRLGLDEGRSYSDAILHAADSTGSALAATTVTLAAGFGVLALSGMHSIAATGALMALTAVLALAVDLLLLPVLGSVVFEGLRANNQQMAVATAKTA